MTSRPQIAWTAEHGAGNKYTEIQYKNCIHVCQGCKVRSLVFEPRQEWSGGSAGQCVMTPNGDWADCLETLARQAS